MGLSLLTNNSLLMDGSEQNLFASQVLLRHYSTKIFFHNMVDNDKIIVKVYDLDDTSAVERKYRTIEVIGVQDNPEMLINWIPSGSYRVTCQQTSGTNKTINFSLFST